MADKPPPHPYLVAASAVLLLGSGQVWNGQPLRGLIFLFFGVLLGGYTLVTAAPDVSIVGKLAGGLFVWAMAIFDAYRTAALRRALWQGEHL